MLKGNKSVRILKTIKIKALQLESIAIIGYIDPIGPVQYDTHAGGEGL